MCHAKPARGRHLVAPPSLPSRGAWIETYTAAKRDSPGCRSPRGERGLKHAENLRPPSPNESLPARGAWIETDYRGSCKAVLRVAPLAGSVD